MSDRSLLSNSKNNYDIELSEIQQECEKFDKNMQESDATDIQRGDVAVPTLKIDINQLNVSGISNVRESWIESNYS